MKFADLKSGLHSPPTRLKILHKEIAFGSEWEGFTVHEILYVNKSEREVVYQVFSAIYVMSEAQFNKKGYQK